MTRVAAASALFPMSDTRHPPRLRCGFSVPKRRTRNLQLTAKSPRAHAAKSELDAISLAKEVRRAMKQLQSGKAVAAYAELLKHDLVVRLDERNVELRLTASNFPVPAELRISSCAADSAVSAPQ